MAAATMKGPQPIEEGSARAQVEACLKAVETTEPAVGAFVRLAPDARSRAAELDRSGGRGFLGGLPVGVKDLMATAGLGTEYGSDIYRGYVPDEDADCVRLLKQAGAVVIGKTATTEFAHLRPAATRNPWNPAHTPGGSSSGSAAAVAAGMVPASLGTQTGGSVIRPASYCGVFAFKASQGRASMKGIHPLAPSFDSLGWFATSSAALWALARVLLTPAPTATTHAVPGRLRLGRLRTPFDDRAHPSITAMCDAACRRLASEGAEVLDVALGSGFDGVHDLHQRVVAVEASRSLASYRGRLSPQLADFVAFGEASSGSYEADLALVGAARRDFAALARDVDALVLPAATGEAPAGLDSTGDASFSLPFSLLGAPCASLPAGLGPNGLPLGLQLVTRQGGDEALLSAVSVVSQRLGLEPMPLAPLARERFSFRLQNSGAHHG